MKKVNIRTNEISRGAKIENENTGEEGIALSWDVGFKET